MHSTNEVESELYPAMFTADDYECSDSDSGTLTGAAPLIFHRSHRSADAILDSSPPITRLVIVILLITGGMASLPPKAVLSREAQRKRYALIHFREVRPVGKITS